MTEIARQTLGVAAVLGLLAATLWWLRRWQPGRGLGNSRRGPRRIERIERITLTPQHSLELVRFDGAAILLALSPSGVTVLERTEWAARDGQAAAAARSELR
jgi:flagellar biogenesis protein FliO